MRILLVGLGAVGQRHARNLRSMFGYELDLIAYRVRRRAGLITPCLNIDESKNVETEYGIRAFDTLESALNEHPDIAVVCNPTSLHTEVALRCAASGCDLFIEKPIGSDLNEVERLVELVKSKSLIGMVGYQLRFHPCIARLRSMLHDGTIGVPLLARVVAGEYLPYWHGYEDYREAYASRADLGGGVVLTQIHDMDYLYWLFGTPRRIFGVGGHFSDLEIDVEDVASILMEFSFGHRALPVHVQLDYVQHPPVRQCEIVGSAGRVVMDLCANELLIYRKLHDGPERINFDGFERNQLFIEELRHFLTCVKNRQKPIVDLEDGVRSLKMALAAKDAMATGTVVELHYVTQVATTR